jgi:hypothetical protein
MAAKEPNFVIDGIGWSGTRFSLEGQVGCGKKRAAVHASRESGADSVFKC